MLRFRQNQKGFTLMEIVVSTAIFATVVTLILVMFNFVLKINRRTEALRQASQGMRNFVEFMAKEIRNGKIDYAVSPVTPIGPCPSSSATYGLTEHRLGLVNVDGDRECIYQSDVSGNYNTSGQYLYIQKNSLPAQELNPPNFFVDAMDFYVRPTSDPYNASPPGIQPFVTLVIRFRVTLPTGEQVIIPYQTTISSDVYDIPHS